MTMKRALDIWHGDDRRFVQDLPRLFPGLPVAKLASAEDLRQLDNHDFALLVSDPENPEATGDRFYPRHDPMHALTSLMSLLRHRGDLPDDLGDQVLNRLTLALPQSYLDHPVIKCMLSEMPGAGAESEETEPIEVLDPGASYREQGDEDEAEAGEFCETCGCSLDPEGQCMDCGMPPDKCECAEDEQDEPEEPKDEAAKGEKDEGSEKKASVVGLGDSKYVAVNEKRAVREACRFFREDKDIDPRILYAGYDKLTQKVAELRLGGNPLPTYTLSTERAKLELEKRAQMTHGPAHSAYKKLADEAEKMPVLKLAALVTEFDETSGLSKFWGGLISRPLAAVTAPVKLAYYMYSDPATGQKVNEDQIIDASADQKVIDEVEKYFGTEMRKQFEKLPIDIFKHLPDRDKLVMSRIILGNTPSQGDKARVVIIQPTNPLDAAFGIRR